MSVLMYAEFKGEAIGSDSRARSLSAEGCSNGKHRVKL